MHKLYRLKNGKKGIYRVGSQPYGAVEINDAKKTEIEEKAIGAPSNKSAAPKANKARGTKTK